MALQIPILMAIFFSPLIFQQCTFGIDCGSSTNNQKITRPSTHKHQQQQPFLRDRDYRVCAIYAIYLSDNLVGRLKRQQWEAIIIDSLSLMDELI